ncbi:MAG: HD domain-containing protein [Desulfobacteraceae bacterium]|nr:HD domain-containing protein [Desulfobacteraceae bacterium]
MKQPSHISSGNDAQLSGVTQMNVPAEILREVHEILLGISEGYDLETIDRAYSLIIDIFEGRHSEFQACNTGYHDLHHTLNVFLALTRLIHGAFVDGERFTDREIRIALISALFHDAGYIQDADDTVGTGAKFTAVHEERSIEFVARMAEPLDLNDKDVRDSGDMILCTNFAVDIRSIPFRSPNVERLGKMLAAADVMAQMADRTYLEKLVYLYRELKESNIGDFESELDLLQQTPGFFDMIDRRMTTILDGVDRFMRKHFSDRWDIPENLYQKAIERHRAYLDSLLSSASRRNDPLTYLKREGLIEKAYKTSGMWAEDNPK